MATNKSQPTQRALFSQDSDFQSFCPDLTMGFISAGKTYWPCVYGAYALKNSYRDLTSEGAKLRPLEFIHLPDSNHFVRCKPLITICSRRFFHRHIMTTQMN